MKNDGKTIQYSIPMKVGFFSQPAIISSEDILTILPDFFLENMIFALDEPSVKTLSQVNKRFYFLITHLLTNNRIFYQQFPQLTLSSLISSVNISLKQALDYKYTPISKKSKAATLAQIPITTNHLEEDIGQSIQMLESQLRLITHLLRQKRSKQLQEVYNLQRDIFKKCAEGDTRGKAEKISTHLAFIPLIIATISSFVMLLSFPKKGNGLALDLLLIAICTTAFMTFCLTFTIPVACIASFLASKLLGQEDELNTPTSIDKLLRDKHRLTIVRLSEKHPGISPHFDKIEKFLAAAHQTIKEIHIPTDALEDSPVKEIANKLHLLLDLLSWRDMRWRGRFIAPVLLEVITSFDDKKLQHLLLQLNRLAITLGDNSDALLEIRAKAEKVCSPRGSFKNSCVLI